MNHKIVCAGKKFKKWNHFFLDLDEQTNDLMIMKAEFSEVLCDCISRWDTGDNRNPDWYIL